MRLHIKDMMSKKIRSISPDISAAEALRILVKKGTSGLPVIDKGGVALGVFTEKEVIKAILPTYLKDVGNFIYAEDSKSELKKIAGLKAIKVSDIMRRDFPTLDEEASLTEASRIMLTRNERRIVVLRNKKAVGIITRYDVVRGLAKEAGVRL